jgi:glycosyltransferase involved in cell wall biosynthesis
MIRPSGSIDSNRAPADGRKTPCLIAAGEFLVHGGSRIDKFVALLPHHGFEPIVVTARENWTARSEQLRESLYPPTLEVHPARSFGYSYFTERFADRSPDDRHYHLLKLLSLPERLLYFPDYMVRWIPDAIRVSARLIREKHIPVVLTSSPLESSHLIGMELKRRLGVRWIADFRDLWTSRTLTYRPPTRLHDRWMRALERRFMTTADHVIANTDENMAFYLREFGVDRQRISVIPNGYDRADIPAEWCATPKSEVFEIGYMGNLSKQGLPWRVFLKAFKLFADEVGRDRVRFVHCGFSSREVDEFLAALDLEAISVRHGLIPHHHAMKIIASVHARVVLLGDNSHTTAQVPAKLYNYLIMQGPVLAIAPARGAVARILDETQMGDVIPPATSPEAVAKMLRGYYNAWTRGVLTVRPNQADTARYDRLEQAGQLAAIFRGVACPDLPAPRRPLAFPAPAANPRSRSPKEVSG